MKEWTEQIPENAMRLYRILKNAGYDTYFVGGCVRDLLQGCKPKDWDMCSAAPAQELVRIYQENGIGLDPTGLEYGTAVADFDGEKYEVASFRTMKGMEERNLYSDLAHRDFTINAMAYDPDEDKIYDFFGGQEDLKNKVLRMTSDPEEEILRSPFNIVRAIRQSIEFGYRIEENTMRAMQKHCDLLETVRVQRIAREIKKCLTYGEAFFTGRGEQK